MFIYQFPIVAVVLAWLTNHLKPWRARTGARSFVIWVILGIYSVSVLAGAMASALRLQLHLSVLGQALYFGLLILAILIPLAGYRLMKSRDLTPNAPPPYPLAYKILEELTLAIVGLVIAYALLWEMIGSSMNKAVTFIFPFGVVLVCHRFFHRFERQTFIILILGIVGFFLLQAFILA